MKRSNLPSSEDISLCLFFVPSFSIKLHMCAYWFLICHVSLHDAKKKKNWGNCLKKLPPE